MTQRQMAPVALLVVLLLAGVAWWHFAVRPSALPAAEVKPLLADHTLLGAWGSSSRRYVLYLGPDGAATYREVELAAVNGSWRLEDDGTVCLVFDEMATNCYGVGREGESLVWILPGAGRTYPFTTQPGRIEGL